MRGLVSTHRCTVSITGNRRRQILLSWRPGYRHRADIHWAGCSFCSGRRSHGALLRSLYDGPGRYTAGCRGCVGWIGCGLPFKHHRFESKRQYRSAGIQYAIQSTSARNFLLCNSHQAPRRQFHLWRMHVLLTHLPLPSI